MKEILLDTSAFIVAVFSQWQNLLLGGGAGATLALLLSLYERLSERVVGKRLYILTFMIGFLFVAFFLAWREQYKLVAGENQKRIAAEKQLEDLTVPQLFGNIRQYSSAVGPFEGADAFIVLIVVSIGNRGADSIAAGHELLLTTVMGRTFSLAPTVFPNDINVSFGGQQITIKKGSEIFNLTSTPIRRGELPTGHMFFVVKDHSLLTNEDHASEIKVRFVDYVGKSYETSLMVLTKGNAMPVLRYYPGAGFEVKPQAPPSAR